jgi:hypothetical protein
MLTQHAPKLVVLLLALLVAGGIIAAKAPTEARQYDYVSLMQEYNIVYVTQGTAKYERIKVDSEAGTKLGNLEPLFIKINEFEGQGYELVSSNAFADNRQQVLLRRPK